jgi:homoserine kinase type II
MAYLTELNEDNIKNIVFKYKLVDYIKCTPIYEGIQNSNYVITTKKQKYILTIFEDKYVASNLDNFLHLMLFLKKSGFTCPTPIKDSKSNIINLVSNKPYSLFTFLNGKSLSKSRLSHFNLLGIDIAKLHIISFKYSKKLRQRFNNNFYINTFKDNNSIILEYNSNIENIFHNVINDYRNLNKFILPKGIIHGDLFPDNILFNKGKISGFIDFYFSNYDFLISDIAIVIISWCFDTTNYNLNLNMVKVNILLKSYNAIRKISNNELIALNILCKIYCIRFFLTRLLDKKNKKDSNKVLTKDPIEYIYKLLYFDKNHINFEQVITHE